MIFHYWDPSMDREDGARFDTDLCGNVNSGTGYPDKYTHDESEVTCERCLAALRTLSGAASPGCQGAPPSAPSPTPAPVPAPAGADADRDALAALKSYSRLAVLAERERCIRVISKMFNYEGNSGSRTLVVAIAAAIRESVE